MTEKEAAVKQVREALFAAKHWGMTIDYGTQTTQIGVVNYALQKPAASGLTITIEIDGGASAS